MNTKLPKMALLKSETMLFSKAPKVCHLAIAEANCVHDYAQLPKTASIRLETYSIASVKRLLKHWDWERSLDKLYSDEVHRIKKIMRLIPTKGQWPYVSYWVNDMTELLHIEHEDDGISVPNHGDGWHRMIASIELKLPTFQFLFLEK